MADQATLDAIETGELIIQVDTGRAAGDPFKLPASLQTTVSSRLADTKAKHAAVAMTEGATVGAAGQRKQALERLAELARNGHKAIGAVASDDLPDAERLQVYTAYGWQGGEIGDMSSATRIETLGNLAVTASADPTVPTAGKYPASLVTRISNWLGILDAASVLATGGDAQALRQARNDARDELETAIARVRFAYYSASDDTDSTPELAKINMQPRRAPGDAKPQPLPDPAGTATFDAATRALTIPALPAHATSIRAYRQVMGGTAEPAGISNSTTVSVVDFSPLTPGASYQLWVVGVNSRGEGAASNKVNFTA